MAVYDDKDFAASPDRTAAIDLSRLLNLAGAVLSVTLVAGLGFWGYRLAVRDVRGIPVIRALEGPARVAPADPGGDITRHQGLAVNAVAAEGTAEPPPDSLVLAPRPADLASDDPPMGELPAAAAIDAATRDVAGPEPDAMAAAMTEASRRLPADGVALSGGGAIPASVPGVAVSPVPRPRPGSEGAAAMASADAGSSGGLSAAPAVPAIEEPTPVDAVVVEGEDPVAEAAAAAVAAALAPQQLDLDPAALAPGTRVVQLGTFDTPDEARAGWDAIARQFAPLLDGKRRVVERTETGGERFYRLRAAGFTDVDDARRFCAVLEDAGTGCVPAIVR